jgi:DNA-binding MarR family transcriptional regulator
LCEVLAVSKQAVHRPLQELVRRRLVEVTPSASNRRLKQLTLTREGAALEERLSGVQRERLAAVFAKIGSRAEAAWREVMRLLTESLTKD